MLIVAQLDVECVSFIEGIICINMGKLIILGVHCAVGRRGKNSKLATRKGTPF